MNRLLIDSLNAVTGWGWQLEDVPKFGSMVSKGKIRRVRVDKYMEKL